MDDVSELRLARVHPKLADLVRAMSDALELEALPIRVVQGLRSWQEQAAFWAKGRDSDGNVIDLGAVVTDAPPGHSWHEFGLAVDVCPIKFLSLKDWGVGKPEWNQVVSAGEAQGLYSGSHFVHPKPDWPHFQLTGSLPVSPNDYVRDAYSRGGIEAVWTAAGMFVSPLPPGSTVA